MKKSARKLSLNRETLRFLQADVLSQVAGATAGISQCETQCDTASSCPGGCTGSCQTCARLTCKPQTQ